MAGRARRHRVRPEAGAGRELAYRVDLQRAGRSHPAHRQQRQGPRQRRDGLRDVRAFGQILPANSFLQSQVGMEQPTHTATAPRAVFWRTALGKSFRQEQGVGRMWSPMVELLADRDLVTGAKTNWDVLPQFQVTLNRRQHVRANVGVRVPANNRAGRSMQVVVLSAWDWFDGGLLEGWR